MIGAANSRLRDLDPARARSSARLAARADIPRVAIVGDLVSTSASELSTVPTGFGGRRKSERELGSTAAGAAPGSTASHVNLQLAVTSKDH